jgi:hypothetical protein
MGLMDWCGPTTPTAGNLRGCKVLNYGAGHVKWSLTETGLPVLGNLGLEDYDHWRAEAGAWADLEVGTMTLGGDGLEPHAHAHFGRHFPEQPSPATERPTPLQDGRLGL